MKKTFVLDTCVLIHDPECLHNFGDNDIFIPLEVIKELDRIKTESSARGLAARLVQRKLLKYLPETGTEPKALPGGGRIGILITPKEFQGGFEVLGDISNPDHKIIAATQYLEQKCRTEIILVSKDMGMAIKARACNLRAEDYKFDKNTEQKEPEITGIKLAQTELNRFAAEGLIELPQKRIPGDLVINSYGIFEATKKMPWRYTGFGRFVRINTRGIQIPNGIEIRAKNIQQAFLLDALLNPDIHLVTAYGPAGTGKTLITVAAALHLIGARIYTGLCIAKPNESVGSTNGFLPGTIEEKMRPWLQPYADALNFLHQAPRLQGKTQSNRKEKGGAPARKPYDILTESGVVEITAIEHIRGRSIPNRFIVVDEAQNIEPKITKTITSRVAEGTKLVYLGDPEQIDNPYLDEFSNGLVHVRSKMKGLANAAHVHLHKGERSLLAEQAAKLL